MSKPPIDIRVTGVEKVMQALQKELKKIKGRNKRGMIKASFVILASAQKRCPVEFGNLKASGFLVWKGGEQNVTTPAWKTETPKGKLIEAGVLTGLTHAHDEAVRLLRSMVKKETKDGVGIGFSAYYAFYVHEDVAAKHKAGKQAKFLESAVRDNMDRVVRIIATEAKKK